MKLFLFFGILLLAILILRYWPIGYYDGLISDHCDGEFFYNPGSPYSKSFYDVIKWQATVA